MCVFDRFCYYFSHDLYDVVLPESERSAGHMRRILKLNAYFIESYGIVKKILFFYKGLKKKKSQNFFEHFSKFDFKMIAIIGKSIFFIQISFLAELGCPSRV